MLAHCSHVPNNSRVAVSACASVLTARHIVVASSYLVLFDKKFPEGIKSQSGHSSMVVCSDET